MIFSKERLLSNWHLMRIFRLAIGLWLAIGAIYMKELMFGVMGVFFIYQALADTSCCGAAGCNTTGRQRPFRKPAEQNDIDVDYEEVQ